MLRKLGRNLECGDLSPLFVRLEYQGKAVTSSRTPNLTASGTRSIYTKGGFWKSVNLHN